jgi:TatD DNase family protein
VVAVGGDVASNHAVVALARAHASVLPALGCHPERLDLDPGELDALEGLLREHRRRVVAVGEVGLPWYALAGRADASSCAAAGRERLSRILAVAKRLDLPVSLHAPHGAAVDALDLLTRSGAGPAVFHWHKADPETTRRLVAAGHYVGVTPEVAWRERDRALVRSVPLDRLVPESDGPWPYRSTPGEPGMVAGVAVAVAEVLARPPDEVVAALAENGRRCFRLPP